jgi:hypothetical protein
MSRPLGLKVALKTGPLSPGRTTKLLPVLASQTRAVPSGLAVRTISPSGLKEALRTLASWPRKTAMGFPVAASQTRAV